MNFSGREQGSSSTQGSGAEFAPCFTIQKLVGYYKSLQSAKTFHVSKLSRKDLHSIHTTRTSTAGGGALGFVEQNHGLHKIKREQGFSFDSWVHFHFTHHVIFPLLSFEPVIICCDIIHKY